MHTDKFSARHIGPRNKEIKEMLSVIGLSSVDELINKTVPHSILSGKKLKLDKAMSE